ncbi:hypothetical protein OA167_00750 [Pelagibacteraceae bacterium]|nr:hypothetical protein [Pelagibacteraceae bacterium]
MYKKMHKEGYAKKDGGFIEKDKSFNGENAHITVNEPEWWYEKIVEIIKIKKNLKIICNCTIYKDGKLKLFPLQFNDKINNYI